MAWLFILPYFLMLSDEEKRLWSSSLRRFQQPPITYSISNWNILLFSNTFHLYCALNVTDQVSNPCRATNKSIINIKGIHLEIIKSLI
jgi:hypothetical protein